jgi:hypothetical protein
VKKLLPAVILIWSAVAFGADEPQPRPGFWERAWDSTRNGAGRLWGSTKRAGEKTAELAKSPFQKKGAGNPAAGAAWQSLTMTMKLDPAAVRLPETRVVEVKVAVVNRARKAVQLDFPTSQRIEVLLKDEAGRVLSRWSDDQRLDREQGFILVNPGERLEYDARISTRDMAAGRSYQIEAFFPGYDRLRTSRTVTPAR